MPAVLEDIPMVTERFVALERSKLLSCHWRLGEVPLRPTEIVGPGSGQVWRLSGCSKMTGASLPVSLARNSESRPDAGALRERLPKLAGPLKLPATKTSFGCLAATAERWLRFVVTSGLAQSGWPEESCFTTNEKT